MQKTRLFLLSSAVLTLGLFALPSYAEEAHADCDTHATHIDKEIGAEKALEAFHVLHGDQTDEHHVVEALKKDHPDVEHELEEFVKAGCTAEHLQAHAHDADAAH